MRLDFIPRGKEIGTTGFNQREKQTMENSQINWTRHSFNEWIGCAHKSEGCRHCYAQMLASRWYKMAWGPGTQRKRTSEANRKLPYRWNRAAVDAGERHRVFTASMADIFDEEVPLEWLGDLLAKIDGTPNLDWLLLTKRASSIKKRLKELGEWNRWPRPNIWLGVTAENQRRADDRIPPLLEVPAVVHFLSAEPLLGPISIPLIGEIDWVIVGGESGNSPRPMHPDWARSLREQCVEEGRAFFFKQCGGRSPKSAGRLLDGREWSQFPMEGGGM